MRSSSYILLILFFGIIIYISKDKNLNNSIYDTTFCSSVGTVTKKIKLLKNGKYKTSISIDSHELESKNDHGIYSTTNNKIHYVFKINNDYNATNYSSGNIEREGNSKIKSIEYNGRLFNSEGCSDKSPHSPKLNNLPTLNSTLLTDKYYCTKNSFIRNTIWKFEKDKTLKIWNNLSDPRDVFNYPPYELWLYEMDNKKNVILITQIYGSFRNFHHLYVHSKNYKNEVLSFLSYRLSLVDTENCIN